MWRSELPGHGAPGLDAVDDVGRLALAVGRLGLTLVLSDVTPELGHLLDLAGLSNLTVLVVEMDRQPEGGEQAVGVEDGQEEVHPGDLPP